MTFNGFPQEVPMNALPALETGDLAIPATSAAPAAAYVVSQDLELLLRRWFSQRFEGELSLPYDDIRHRLSTILAFGTHEVLMVSESEILGGLMRLLSAEKRPVISVDPVYWPSENMLHVTRGVDENFVSVPGLHPRYGHVSPSEQVAALVADLGATPHEQVEVVLVDDIVFSGSVMVALINLLAPEGVKVVRVVCGIAVAEVGGKNPFDLCRQHGAELEAVFSFGTPGTRQASDEICERDFFVFAPMCGRTYVGVEGNVGAPYVAPFGRPRDWASFGESEASVSRALIALNIYVLELIEAQIGRALTFADLDRQPARVRHPDVAGDQVRLHLERHLAASAA